MWKCEGGSKVSGEIKKTNLNKEAQTLPTFSVHDNIEKKNTSNKKLVVEMKSPTWKL